LEKLRFFLLLKRRRPAANLLLVRCDL